MEIPIFLKKQVDSLQCEAELPMTYKPQISTKLKNLERIVEHLKEFLRPVLPSLNTLIFLEMKESKILKTTIEHFLHKKSAELSYLDLSSNSSFGRHHFSHSRHKSSDPNSLKLYYQTTGDSLNNAVQKAEKIVLDLIEDHVSIWIIKEIFGINNSSLKLSSENETLREFRQMKLGPGTMDISESFTSVSELILARDYIFAIQKTCQAFNLDNCLNDPDMKIIVDIANRVKMADDITVKDAKEMVQKIKKCLQIKVIIDNPTFHLFSLLQNHNFHKFYRFALQRGYDSEHGMETFRQEHQLVTTELLHEDHDTELLSILQSAMHCDCSFF